MMKDKNRNYIFIGLGILVLIIAAVVIVKVNTKEELLGVKRGSLSQIEASELIQKLEEEICVDATYPSWYGGVCIRNKNVVVMITKDSKDAKDTVLEILGQEDSIIIRYVKYSYDYLSEVQDKIMDNYMEHHEEAREQDVQLARLGMDIERNQIEVGIKDISNRKIRKFKKWTGKYDCVRYVESDGVYE